MKLDDDAKTLRDLSEMNRDFGLGIRYFLVVGGILVALMAWLFLWGRVSTDDEPAPVPVVAPIPAAPSAP